MSCEHRWKRSASEALPSSVSNRILPCLSAPTAAPASPARARRCVGSGPVRSERQPLFACPDFVLRHRSTFLRVVTSAASAVLVAAENGRYLGLPPFRLHFGTLAQQRKPPAAVLAGGLSPATGEVQDHPLLERAGSRCRRLQLSPHFTSAASCRI